MVRYSLIFLLLSLVLSTNRCQELSVIHLESPNYHHLARAAGLQGEVRVQVKIAADGKVVSTGATSGHQLLRREAESNVQKWLFNSGEDRTLDVLYEFRLEEPEVYCDPPSRVTFDLPHKVRVVSNFARPDHR